MSLGTRAVVLVAVAALLLSGCSSTPGPVNDIPRLTRHITLSLSSNVQPPESPQQLLQEHGDVMFEYAHAGDAVATEDLAVEYTAADGTPAQAPLSDFTEKDVVNDGDVVQIAPGEGGTETADILTPMAVVAGDDTLAERTGGDRQWLQAGGAPLPLAFTEAGSTSWAVAASGGLDIRLSGLSATSQQERCTYAEQAPQAPPVRPGPDEPYDPNATYEPPAYQPPTCEPYTSTFDLDTLEVALSERVSATFTATSSLPAEGPRIAFHVNGTARAEADLDVALRSDGEGHQGTVDGWLEATVPSAEVALQFDASRELQTITRQGEAILDSDATMGGDFQEFAPPSDRPHPLEHDTFGPETEPWEAGPAAPDELVRFLSRAWGLDIDVGDEVAFDMQMPGMGGSSNFVSQVLAREDRVVDGKTRSTFRLSDSFVLSLDPHGATDRVISYEYTYWVDAASYLPIHMQGHVERTFNKAELEVYIASVNQATGDNVDVRLPDDARLTLRLDSTLDLLRSDHDLATSPVMGAAGVRLVPLLSANLLVGPAFLGTPLFGMGSGSSSEAMRAPSLTFSQDQVARTLTVVRAEAGIDWMDLEIEGCSDHPTAGPVESDQTISGCTEEMVTISHIPTNSMLGMFWFEEA